MPLPMRSMLLLLVLSLPAAGAEDTTAKVLQEARAILTDQRSEASTRSALNALLRQGDPAARAVVIAAVADARPPWFGSFASENLGDPSSQVRAASVSALARAWPTTVDDLERVRRLLSDQDPVVVQAAAGFAGRVHDDGAVPTLIDRLDQDQTGTIRKTLVSLAGPDAGSTEAWRDRLREREGQFATAVEKLRGALDQGDESKAREAVHGLLALSHQKVMVGKVLRDLAENGSPALARLAREGLGTLGGPMADCLPPPVAGTQVALAAPVPAVAAAPAAPTTTIDPVGLAVGLAIVGILGTMGWLLWQAKPVQAATRRIARVTSERFTKAIINPAKRAKRQATVAITRPASRRIKSMTARVLKPKAPK